MTAAEAAKALDAKLRGHAWYLRTRVAADEEGRPTLSVLVEEPDHAELEELTRGFEGYEVRVSSLKPSKVLAERIKRDRRRPGMGAVIALIGLLALAAVMFVFGSGNSVYPDINVSEVTTADYLLHCKDSDEGFEKRCKGKKVLWVGAVRDRESERRVIVEISSIGERQALELFLFEAPREWPRRDQKVVFSGVLYARNGWAHDVKPAKILEAVPPTQQELAAKAESERKTKAWGLCVGEANAPSRWLDEISVLSLANLGDSKENTIGMDGDYTVRLYVTSKGVRKYFVCEVRDMRVMAARLSP